MRGYLRGPAAIMGVAILGLLIGGGWFYRTQEGHVRRQVEQQLASIARLKAEQIRAWREERLDEGAEIAERPLLNRQIARWLKNPEAGGREQLLAELRVLQRRDEYADILLVDRTGRVRLSVSGSSVRHAGTVQELANALREGRPALTDLHREAGTPLPHVAVVAPLSAGNRRGQPPLGAVILVSDARQFLYPLIQSWPVPSGSAETLLVRREGDHVLFLNDLRYQEGAALSLRIPLTRTEVPAVMAVLGKEGVFEGRDYRGVEVLSALGPVPDSPWFIVAKVDRAEALAPWRSRSGLIVALLLASAICLAALGVAVWQRRERLHYRSLFAAESARRQEEERFRVTLMSIGDGVIVTDAAGRITLQNPVAERLTGWGLDEARGRPLEEVFRIVNELTRRTVENPAVRVLREGTVVGLANHTLLVARDGTERPIADSGAPIPDPDGAVAGVVLVFRDQSEERAAREALAASEIRYRTLADSGQALIWTSGLDRKCDYFNLPWLRFTGRRLEQELGDGWVEGVHPDDLARCVETYVRAFDRRERFSMEYRLRHAGGGYRWIVDEGSPRYDSRGEFLGYIGHCLDVTEQKLAREAIREQVENLRYILKHDPNAIAVYDRELRYLAVSDRYLQDYSVLERDVIGKHHYEVFPEMPQKWKEVHRRCLAGAIERNDDDWFERPDGSITYNRWECRPWYRADGQIGGIITYTEVTTARKLAEAEKERLQGQLLQAQKMEAVGRLAGGIAHDFNNLLMGILNYVELSRDGLASDHPVQAYLAEIAADAERSATLTRQLLAFARKQTVAPRLLDLNDTVAGMLKLLRRLIGEQIELVWRPGAGLGAVRIDPSQVDQILVNLLVNARDAIVGTGTITLETAPVTVTGDAPLPGLPPGDYACLIVSDTGAGMDASIQARLFEPYFTTKTPGQGTGLGLATVYGIVQQNGGQITVYSEVGRGTAIKLYLPRVAETAAAVPTAAPPAAAPRGGGETVLVVEDERSIRTTCSLFLGELGYTVLTAATPAEALTLAAAHEGEIRLLLTDVVLPEMTGRELAERLQAARPGTACLYMSGYTANVIAHQGVLDPGVWFLQKPFSRHELAAKVRAVLGEG